MNGRMPTLCVVAGPNGSGKTTTTIQLLNDEWTSDSLYINPDNIAQETFGDWNSSEAVLKAAELATQQRYECLQQGNVSRITQRYLNGGHEVPISKVISRYYKSIQNAAKAISFVNRAYVYDNSIDGQLPRLLYRTVDGIIFKQYTNNIPLWAEMLIRK